MPQVIDERAQEPTQAQARPRYDAEKDRGPDVPRTAARETVRTVGSGEELDERVREELAKALNRHTEQFGKFGRHSTYGDEVAKLEQGIKAALALPKDAKTKFVVSEFGNYILSLKNDKGQYMVSIEVPEGQKIFTAEGLRKVNYHVLVDILREAGSKFFEKGSTMSGMIDLQGYSK
jgi:hypothetical protein